MTFQVNGSISPLKKGDWNLLNFKLLLDFPSISWWIEDKPLGFALHYRQAAPGEERRIINALNPALAQKGEADYQILRGKKVVEFLPPGVSKGAPTQEILQYPGFSGLFPVYIGDDATDESAFQTLKGQGLTIKVGGAGEATLAAHSLAHPTEVRQLMSRLAA
jgi:trehalose-phosphatase